MRINDSIDRTLAQIGQAEEEIYEQLQEADPRIRTANSEGLQDFLSLSADDRTLGNLQVAEAMADDSSDHAVLANQLKNLLGARIAALEAREDVVEQVYAAHQVNGTYDPEEVFLTNQLGDTIDLKNTYIAKFNDDLSSVSGDAKIFKE